MCRHFHRQLFPLFWFFLLFSISMHSHCMFFIVIYYALIEWLLLCHFPLGAHSNRSAMFCIFFFSSLSRILLLLRHTSHCESHLFHCSRHKHSHTRDSVSFAFVCLQFPSATIGGFAYYFFSFFFYISSGCSV